MRCARCQQENPPESNFCLGCGVRLGLTCASCGTDLPPEARFCNKCGTPVKAQGTEPRLTSPESYTPKHLAEKILTSKASLEGERKQVTVLFADLKGSMELLADRDPEEARKILDPVLERMMEAIHRYEGTVNQVLGDGITPTSTCSLFMNIEGSRLARPVWRSAPVRPRTCHHQTQTRPRHAPAASSRRRHPIHPALEPPRSYGGDEARPPR
jgi:double zinc ribbon protein